MFTVQYDNVSLWGKCWAQLLTTHCKRFGFTKQCEELTHWKRLWCWEGLGAEGEGDDRGWDGWMASLTRWTWVWVISRSWWWTGRPGVLRFMGSQKVGHGHDWATELNWTETVFLFCNASHCVCRWFLALLCHPVKLGFEKVAQENDNMAGTTVNEKWTILYSGARFVSAASIHDRLTWLTCK